MIIILLDSLVTESVTTMIGNTTEMMESTSGMLETTREMFNSTMTTKESLTTKHKNEHNDKDESRYVGIAVIVGIVGAFIIGVIIFYYFKRWWKLRNTYNNTTLRYEWN